MTSRILDSEFFVAVVHICLGEAVPGIVGPRISFHPQLKDLDRVFEFLHGDQSITEPDEFILAEVVGGGLRGPQLAILLDRGIDVFLPDRFCQGIRDGLSGGERLNRGEHLVERSPRNELASIYDGGNSLRVADIVERIGIQQNQIRDFSRLNRAEILLLAQESRRVQRGRLQSLHGREPGLHQETQFIVQAEAWKAPA